MPLARLVFAVVVIVAADASAQGAPSAPAPAPPQTTPPPAPGATTPGATTPGALTPAGATPVAPTARAFTAPTGMMLNAVRSERSVDFELVIGYLQAAFAKSASPQIRAQAQGWRMYKATEPGPNNTVLYVFLLDPAVGGADYALGPILSDAYPEQVEQIWKLYQGALAGPGSQSLLNLTPVEAPPLPPVVPPPAGTPPPLGTPPPGAPPPGSGLPGTAPAPTSGPAAPPPAAP